jgi:hypothetical protein
MGHRREPPTPTHGQAWRAGETGRLSRAVLAAAMASLSRSRASTNCLVLILTAVNDRTKSRDLGLCLPPHRGNYIGPSWCSIEVHSASLRQVCPKPLIASEPATPGGPGAEPPLDPLIEVLLRLVAERSPPHPPGAEHTRRFSMLDRSARRLKDSR